VVVPAHKPPPRCACGGDSDALLKPLVERGRIARDLPPPRTLREHVLEQLRRVELAAPEGRPRGDY
jgi:hypothetical protein